MLVDALKAYIQAAREEAARRGIAEQVRFQYGNFKGRLNENSRLLLFLTWRTRIAQWTGTKWWGTHLFDPDALADELRQAGGERVQFKKMPVSWEPFMFAVEASIRSGITNYSVVGNLVCHPRPANGPISSWISCWREPG